MLLLLLLRLLEIKKQTLTKSEDPNLHRLAWLPLEGEGNAARENEPSHPALTPPPRAPHGSNRRLSGLVWW